MHLTTYRIRVQIQIQPRDCLFVFCYNSQLWFVCVCVYVFGIVMYFNCYKYFVLLNCLLCTSFVLLWSVSAKTWCCIISNWYSKLFHSLIWLFLSDVFFFFFFFRKPFEEKRTRKIFHSQMFNCNINVLFWSRVWTIRCVINVNRWNIFWILVFFFCNTQKKTIAFAHLTVKSFSFPVRKFESE